MYVKNILSEIQVMLGDGDGQKFGRAMYIDAFKNISMHIASQTEVWMNRATVVPRDTTVADWANNTAYIVGDKVKSGGVIYTCIRAHTSSLGASNILTDHEAGSWEYTSEAESDSKFVYLSNLSIYRLLNVFRTYTNSEGTQTFAKCREYSMQTIQNNFDGKPFDINTTSLDEMDFAVFPQHGRYDTTNDSMILLFGSTFEETDRVVVDYISNRPLDTMLVWLSTTATPQFDIPDYLYFSFKYGALWQMAESLFAQGDESKQGIMVMAKANYDKYVRDAAGYTKNLKSNPSSLQAQPLNWLPE